MRYFVLSLAAILLLSCYSSACWAATYVYVANEYDHTVSIMDARDHSIVGTVDVGDPTDIEGHPGSVEVYVTDSTENDLHVIGTESSSVVEEVTLSAVEFDHGARGIAVNEKTQTAYVINFSKSSLLALSLESWEILDRIDVGDGPTDILFDRVADKIYTLNSSDTSISVIDAETFSLVDTININLNYHVKYGDIDPADERLYLAAGHGMIVVDTSINEVESEIDLPRPPTDLVFDERNSNVYVIGGYSGSTLSVIDSKSLTVRSTYEFDFGSTRIASHPEREWVYVTDRREGSLSIIDTQSGEIVDVVEMGKYPGSVAVVTGIPVVSAPESVGYSGSWYKEETTGQGFSFEVVPASSVEDTDELLVYWFTYARADGSGVEQQRWYVSNGALTGSESTMDVFKVTGGVFDDPAPVTEEIVGRATVSFEGCDSAFFTYKLDLNGDDDWESEGDMNLVRLTPNVLCENGTDN